jgi:hypothetical protein
MAHFDCSGGMPQVGFAPPPYRWEAFMTDRNWKHHRGSSVSGQFLAAVLVALLMPLMLLPGCSSSSPKCPSFTGTFTNASLGPAGTQWAYELSGWILNSSGVYTPYTEAGVLTVDGNGNITVGTDTYWGTITNGTYSVTSNGSGAITLNTSNQSGTQALFWGITVANGSTTNSPGLFSVIETDSFANSAGAAYQQSAATSNTAPSGTFVFRTHVTTAGTSIAGSENSVGVITFSSASVNGSEDWVNGGVASGQSTNFTGTFTPPSAGIGSVSFTDGLGARTFDYFVIDANDLLLYETDSANVTLGLGRAELQQTPQNGFVNASFSGSFAFGGRGDTSAGAAGGVNEVGQLAADGNGNVSSGSLDSVRDGAPFLAQTIAPGTYTTAANGRLTTTLNTSGEGNVPAVLYLISPTRAYFLVNDTTAVEDGSVDQQSTTSFSNSTFNGQYAFVMGGIVAGIPVDRTGPILADGNGNLGWGEQVNSGGIAANVCLSGTYSAAPNGRVAASVSPVSNNIILYLVSPNAAYTIQGDAETQVPGALVNQDHQVMTLPVFF